MEVNNNGQDLDLYGPGKENLSLQQLIGYINKSDYFQAPVKLEDFQGDNNDNLEAEAEKSKVNSFHLNKLNISNNSIDIDWNNDKNQLDQIIANRTGQEYDYDYDENLDAELLHDAFNQIDTNNDHKIDKDELNTLSEILNPNIYQDAIKNEEIKKRDHEFNLLSEFEIYSLVKKALEIDGDFLFISDDKLNTLKNLADGSETGSEFDLNGDGLTNDIEKNIYNTVYSSVVASREQNYQSLSTNEQVFEAFVQYSSIDINSDEAESSKIIILDLLNSSPEEFATKAQNLSEGEINKILLSTGEYRLLDSIKDNNVYLSSKDLDKNMEISEGEKSILNILYDFQSNLRAELENNNSWQNQKSRASEAIAGDTNDTSFSKEEIQELREFLTNTKNHTRKFDLNGDQQISDEERNIYQEIYSEFMTNKNTEFNNLTELERNNMIKSTFDTDGDSTLNSDEFDDLQYMINNGIESDSMDLDGNYIVTRSEKNIIKDFIENEIDNQKNQFNNRNQLERLNQAKSLLEKNQDGTLNRIEMRMLDLIVNSNDDEIFKKYDLNGDALITSQDRLVYTELRDSIRADGVNNFSSLSLNEKKAQILAFFETDSIETVSEENYLKFKKLIDESKLDISNFESPFDLDGNIGISSEEATLFNNIFQEIQDFRTARYDSMTDDQKKFLAASRFDFNKDGDLNNSVSNTGKTEIEFLRDELSAPEDTTIFDLNNDGDIDTEEINIFSSMLSEIDSDPSYYENLFTTMTNASKNEFAALTRDEKLAVAKTVIDKNKNGEIDDLEIKVLKNLLKYDKIPPELDLDGDLNISSEEKKLLAHFVVPDIFRVNLDAINQDKTDVDGNMILFSNMYEGGSLYDFMNNLAISLEEKSSYDGSIPISEFIAIEYGFTFSANFRSGFEPMLDKVREVTDFTPTNTEFAEVLLGSTNKDKFDYRYIDLDSSNDQINGYSQFGYSWLVLNGEGNPIENSAVIDSNVIQKYENDNFELVKNATILNELAHKNIKKIFENPEKFTTDINFFNNVSSYSPLSTINNNQEFNEFMSDYASTTIDRKGSTRSLLMRSSAGFDNEAYHATNSYTETIFKQYLGSKGVDETEADNFYINLKDMDIFNFESNFNQFATDNNLGNNINFNDFSNEYATKMRELAEMMMEYLRDNKASELSSI